MRAIDIKPLMEKVAKDLNTHDFMDYSGIGLEHVLTRYPVRGPDGDTADVVVCVSGDTENPEELLQDLAKLTEKALFISIPVYNDYVDAVGVLKDLEGLSAVEVSANNNRMTALMYREVA